MRLTIVFTLISTLSFGQVIVDKGVLTPGYTYQTLTVQVGDSTKIIQEYNGPNNAGPHYATTYRAADGDTSKYIMVTTFYKKYHPAPPEDPGFIFDVTAFGAQSGVTVNGNIVGSVDKTDWIRYDVNLLKARTKILYEYAMSDATGGGVQFRTGSTTGPIIAQVLLPVTGGWSTFNTIELTINPPFGTNSISNIYLTFTNSPRTTGSGGNIKSIIFK